MIVKTGANYQAEGGYIEFSADNPNGVTIINEKEVPTTLYDNVKGITGYMRVKVRKTTGSVDTVRIFEYIERNSLESVKYRDFSNHTVTTSESYIELPLGFGAGISVPAGNKPILADGSNDVRLIRSVNTYFLFITGSNPVAVLSYEEA